VTRGRVRGTCPDRARPTGIMRIAVGWVLLMATGLGAQGAESRASSAPALDDVAFELVAPAAQTRPTETRAAPPVAVIRITNKTAAPVILWPFFDLTVRDVKGNSPKPSSNRGRWGRRSRACFLEGVEFITLEPGKSIERPVRLDPYTHGADAILGWKLAAGEYTLTARWAFSRKDFIARCRLDCASHSEPRRPWNAALELCREASLRIVIK
jgi:hypothetical protein